MSGVVVVVGGLLMLLWVLVDGNSVQAPIQLELVRIALTILLGTGGILTVFASGNKANIDQMNKKDGKQIADAVRARLAT